ncbi:YeeE/YedE family protein [Psychromonas sp. Urea-02u-13]|uniref:YeeE/YedE family protein n=1 Tax=Psychromonas sp. Urea-02u-13 TaxID=2058326 RepID=UPI000C33EAA2|nr:YeeE/YedE thiosulfate transporter family protein [Psychromonas sp. Urea-02u-13]PKG37790.1 hypothetical protein CXF74_16925 [Psychromonas sp. Urea-02u-13]
MENFTPWMSLAGGALLGLSAALLMLFNGKTAGISGVLAGLITPKKNEVSWRIVFLIGMVLSFLLVAPFAVSLPDISGENIFIISLAGLLVGFGTRISNGCTSGHGIIGMGRFSKRSIYATLTFMFVAMVTVFLRGLLGGL